MEKRKLLKNSKKKGSSSGPIFSKDGIPLDYFVIIDAGSKGSRVHVYNWLNPQKTFEKGLSFDQVNFRRSEDVELNEKDDDDTPSSSEDESDSEDDDVLDKTKTKAKTKTKTNTTMGNKNNKPLHFPKIHTKSWWHKKITPGISAFNRAPHKIGKHHLSKLLSRASKIVPKSQHYRTPIFLHATAGMRLLSPTEQQQILNEICIYFEKQSDFFIPDCASHVNVIDGDYEGLYGWLSINSLIGAFNDPESHQHGKNHTTYGLLDMGGASTQVVFQPNASEIEEHQNNLYHLKLRRLPVYNPEKKLYDSPIQEEFSVYSDSFLGFGMFQARTRYHNTLLATDENEPQYHYWGFTKAPITDPCIPKGYTRSEILGDKSYDFIGGSNFESCLTNIFPVLANSTHGGAPKANCKQFNEGDEVSECLLNDLIPSFDFDVNHFIGVSGYWDAIGGLLSQKDKAKRDSSEDQKNTYDYQTIFNKTERVCSQPWSTLLELNLEKDEKDRLTEDELSELCFKSSWILNFLHLGLGFPRFGIDEPTSNSNKKFQTLQLVEKLDGNSFSWALGRAMLYANDEYIQAFNNYSAIQQKDANFQSIDRPGFYHSPSEALYQFGAEQNNIAARPPFEPYDATKTYHYYNYETHDTSDHEPIWNIEPHRWYGMIVFGILLSIVAWLMLGSRKRQLAVTRISSAFRKLVDIVKRKRNSNYHHYRNVSTGDMEIGYELNDVLKDDEVDSRFEIGDEEEFDDDDDEQAAPAPAVKEDGNSDYDNGYSMYNNTKAEVDSKVIGESKSSTK